MIGTVLLNLNDGQWDVDKISEALVRKGYQNLESFVPLVVNQDGAHGDGFSMGYATKLKHIDGALLTILIDSSPDRAVCSHCRHHRILLVGEGHLIKLAMEILGVSTEALEHRRGLIG